MNDVSVLIVEDERISAMALELILKQIGYTVSGRVDRCQDAVNHVKDHRPDVVLMDIRIKGNSDGIDAAREIRSFSDIPVIFITAHSDEETVDGVMEISQYSFLIKPVTKDEIQAAVEEAIVGRNK